MMAHTICRAAPTLGYAAEIMTGCGNRKKSDMAIAEKTQLPAKQTSGEQAPPALPSKRRGSCC